MSLDLAGSRFGGQALRRLGALGARDKLFCFYLEVLCQELGRGGRISKNLYPASSPKISGASELGTRRFFWKFLHFTFLKFEERKKREFR